LVKVFNKIPTGRRLFRKAPYFVLRLLRFVIPSPIKIDGHILFYNPSDYLAIAELAAGHEPEVKNTIAQFLRPGMTMIDAGANIGYFTLFAARMVGPQGHVYAFEPVPSTVGFLRKNVEKNGYSDRVAIVPNAVTDKSSQVRIILGDTVSTVSSMFRNDSRGRDFVDVEAVSLDEFFYKQGWPPVNIVKMDIEGAEKLALDGMRELSRRNPELKLIIEVNLVHFGLEEILEALQGCGFSRFYSLNGQNRTVNILKDLPHVEEGMTRGKVADLLCERGN
jgi:FkbM family methyltransferase